MSSFHVDARIDLKLEYDLAIRLGEFILSSGTEDKQLMALGHKLANLDENENSPRPYNAPRKNYYREKEIIRSTGRIMNNVEQTQGWEEEGDHATRSPINTRNKYSHS